MDAKINHLTILSEDNYALGRFYEGFFHMRPTGTAGATQAVRIGDGHIGLNIKPRLSGHPAQLDHFGIEVDDIELAFARLRDGYPAVEWLERPSSGPSVSISTHDPDGNVFGLSQTGMANHDEFYEVEGREPDRVIHHIAFVSSTRNKWRNFRHCHVNRMAQQRTASMPFQATALASSHTLKASVRSCLNVGLLSKYRWT